MDFALPTLGDRDVVTITPREVLEVLRTVEARGNHETASRLRSTIGSVFRYAVATARAENDPTFALRDAHTTPKVQHRAAITDPKAFGGLLRAIDEFQGQPSTVAALKLMALLFPRPGELRAADWSEFDLETAIWSIPAERMKMHRPHRVPLPPQAVKILTDLSVCSMPPNSMASSPTAISETSNDQTYRAIADDTTGFGRQSGFSGFPRNTSATQSFTGLGDSQNENRDPSSYRNISNDNTGFIGFPGYMASVGQPSELGVGNSSANVT